MQTLILKMLLALVNPELIVGIAKFGLGFLKQAIVSTKTDWDDKTLLPIVEKLEKALG